MEARRVTEIEQTRADIDALAVRIANGEELSRRITAEAANRERREKAEADLAGAQARVDALEELVGLFGPKGLKSTLLGQALDDLNARAEQAMAALTGGEYRMEFTVEGKDGFDVVVHRAGRKAKRVRQLSGSEKQRAGIVCQHILSGLTGLGLLVADEVNMLDPGNKSALMGLVLQLMPEYGTIIVLSALGETAPHNPGIEGLSMFMVEAGTVRELPRPIRNATAADAE
jgi:DNA repair exonuclease SbcCD ATPase subunit